MATPAEHYQTAEQILEDSRDLSEVYGSYDTVATMALAHAMLANSPNQTASQLEEIDGTLTVWQVRNDDWRGEYYTTRAAAEQRAENACAAEHPESRPQWSADSGGRSWTLWLINADGDQMRSGWDLIMHAVHTEPAVDV